MHKIVDGDGDTHWLSASDVCMCSVCGDSISKEQGSICDACGIDNMIDSPDSMFDGDDDAFEFLDNDDGPEWNPLTSVILKRLLTNLKPYADSKAVVVYNRNTEEHEIWYVCSDNTDEQTMHCMAKPDYDVETDVCTKFHQVWSLGGIKIYPRVADDDIYHDVTNEFGFPQYIDDEGHPTCPQCYSMVMPNRGQGTACAKCQHEFLIECHHDYDEGYL